MFARGRSKDRGSEKPAGPSTTYMDNDQFANYLTELRQKRVTRPGGAKTPGASSARTSIDPASSAARTPAATSTTTVNTLAPPPRADSALSNRTTTTTPSHKLNRASVSTSRSRRSMPPPTSPEEDVKLLQLDPTIVQPSATYIERGQRWMEREEAESLRDALEDMDAAERAKIFAVELASEKLRDDQLDEEERIQMAAQKEASELVHAHLYPEEIKRRQEEEERRRMTGYRYHLRKGSYQHARAASVGREYKGEDAVIVNVNPRPGMPSRTVSDESTMRSASRTSMRRESADHSSRAGMENRQCSDEVRGRTPSKGNGKSYGTLSSTVSGVASKSRSWSARRKSGSGKRNISGEVNTIFHPDQIWEEPETSRESSKNRKKEKEAAKTREDMYNDTLQPLGPLKRNPANHVKFANDKDESGPEAENISSSLPAQKIDRFEIFRNPPSQSRNPLYTENSRTRSPSPAKVPEVPMKDGKEIRNEELRKATTKSLKDRSEKLPTPTAVSDRLGRPIVSFDKEWTPAEEKAQKLAEQKKLADLCPPVSAARTKLSESTSGGSTKDNGTVSLTAVEAAKLKIFGSAAQEQVNGSIRERRASRSPQRRGRPSGERQGERPGEESEGGEKGQENERQGYFEVVGGEADKESELGKVGDAKGGNHEAGVGAEVKVTGKWIVETKKGVSTFRIEDEKTLKEQQARKEGFPYRLDKSSANSSTTSLPLAVNLRPAPKHHSMDSTPRTSISQETFDADIDTTPVATPLVSLAHTSLPTPLSEPSKEGNTSTHPIVSIASLNPVDRTSTLMARSPFARPRGESFISRRSIFQPEKSVPALPAPASHANTKTTDNDKPQPFGPSLLSAPRPRPSFLTRTRSRSSVSGHSVFALKKPEPTSSSVEPLKAAPAPSAEDKPATPVLNPQKKVSSEEIRPPISRNRSSESSFSKDLISLPPAATKLAQEPFPTAHVPAKPAVKMTPFGPSLLSAARPRPSPLTRTRSRSSVSAHSVFSLKKHEPSAASPLNETSKPVVQNELPAPLADVPQQKTSSKEVRPPISRANSSDGSISEALPSLPPLSNQEQEPFPHADVPAKPALKTTPFGPSLLSASRPRPTLLTRTRSRSSVSAHSVFSLRNAGPAVTPSSPLKENNKPMVQNDVSTASAHIPQQKTSSEEVRPPLSRAKSSEGSISKELPSLPSLSDPQPQESFPSIEVAAAKPAVKMTPFGPSLLSAARPRPSFLTRTRSRSSVAGHSVFALKKPEPVATPKTPTAPSMDDNKPTEELVPPPLALISPEKTSMEEVRPLFSRAKSSEVSIPRELPTPPPAPVDEAPNPFDSSSAAPIAAPSAPADAAPPKPVSHISNFHLSAARSRPSFLTRTRSRSSVAGHSPYSLKGEQPVLPSAESSSPAPPAHDEDRPPFARSKSSETSIPKATPRQSLDGPQGPRFSPRSPFARPSLGPTSLSTPPEFSLNKQGSVASRSPFGRPGGARSSMSTVSVPPRMTELGPSASVRKSPFDRSKTRDGPTPHTRSSLGVEARNSVDENDRPESRQSFSTTSAKPKLPWMRHKSMPFIDAGELARPRSATAESFKLESPVERPASRGKELPCPAQHNTTSQPENILVDEQVAHSPPALEVTVKTADVAALYHDVLESPTKQGSEVVVNTADIAEQYDLVLNESKPLDEKSNIPAPVVPAVEKKSSLSGARPLPMRPSGPRQSVPSVRRQPREQAIATPPPAKAETAQEKAIPPPPVVVEPPKERPGHKKSTSISAPSVTASVLAPPTETLSEVRPPAPDDAVMEVKPLPTIYGPPRTDTPPGFSMHPPALSIQAPSIAIRAPSPAPDSQATMISVSAPAINVSGPEINVSEATAPAPLRQQSTRPLPQPTRPLPQPGAPARPLPRPSTTSSHRPLPAPANARPIPHPSSRVAPPPNLARPSSDSTSHWSPAPVPAGGRATATCHACSLPIEGRVIALAGLKERWHPACMQCHVCSTALADFEISPEPSFARAARLARIEAREAGEYVAEGESTDGDKRLRFYCHLDWHEAFAPRCQHCKTPIIGEHITALGGKHYHYGHFFCCECGDPFNQGVPHVELEGYAWCTRCMEKRTERRAPRCGLCKRNVVGEVVRALGKEFHRECFRCGDCQGTFEGEIYLRDDVGVSCRECMERWAKNGGR